MTGKQVYEPRWRECVDVVVEMLPIATSALYVKNFFNQESRTVALELVDSLKDEFQKMLKEVSWMDDDTKEAALEKAQKMTAHIGFPDELMDEKKIIEYYKGLKIDENNYLESIIDIGKFGVEKSLKTYRKPVNKTDWESHASVAIVNAFFNPLENSIRKFRSSDPKIVN